MRYIALVVMVGAACSDSHYGTYLDVEGDGTIMFDRVEFYFGDYKPGAPVPTSPRRADPHRARVPRHADLRPARQLGVADARRTAVIVHLLCRRRARTA
jgi:hypothetical protein